LLFSFVLHSTIQLYVYLCNDTYIVFYTHIAINKSVPSEVKFPDSLFTHTPLVISKDGYITVHHAKAPKRLRLKVRKINPSMERDPRLGVVGVNRCAIFNAVNLDMSVFPTSWYIKYGAKYYVTKKLLVMLQQKPHILERADGPDDHKGLVDYKAVLKMFYGYGFTMKVCNLLFIAMDTYGATNSDICYARKAIRDSINHVLGQVMVLLIFRK
jgi:hypothetical protein